MEDKFKETGNYWNHCKIGCCSFP